MIVRGLDYYTKTVFEIISDEIGAKGTVCGGGRYDGLIQEVGGPDMPGVGFGMGMERLLMVLEGAGYCRFRKPDELAALYSAPWENRPDRAWLFDDGEAAGRRDLMQIWTTSARSLKAQMKYANKLGASNTAGASAR